MFEYKVRQTRGPVLSLLSQQNFFTKSIKFSFYLWCVRPTFGSVYRDNSIISLFRVIADFSPIEDSKTRVAEVGGCHPMFSPGLRSSVLTVDRVGHCYSCLQVRK